MAGGGKRMRLTPPRTTLSIEPAPTDWLPAIRVQLQDDEAQFTATMAEAISSRWKLQQTPPPKSWVWVTVDSQRLNTADMLAFVLASRPEGAAKLELDFLPTAETPKPWMSSAPATTAGALTVPRSLADSAGPGGSRARLAQAGSTRDLGGNPGAGAAANPRPAVHVWRDSESRPRPVCVKFPPGSPPLEEATFSLEMHFERSPPEPITISTSVLTMSQAISGSLKLGAHFPDAPHITLRMDMTAADPKKAATTSQFRNVCTNLLRRNTMFRVSLGPDCTTHELWVGAHSFMPSNTQNLPAGFRLLPHSRLAYRTDQLTAMLVKVGLHDRLVSGSPAAPLSGMGASPDQRPALVIDIDNTLLLLVEKKYASRRQELKHRYGKRLCCLKRFGNQEAKDVVLASGAVEFLNCMQQHFKLYLCSLGYPEYVEQVKQLLDPDGKLFQPTPQVHGNDKVSHEDRRGFAFSARFRCDIHASLCDIPEGRYSNSAKRLSDLLPARRPAVILDDCVYAWHWSDLPFVIRVQRKTQAVWQDGRQYLVTDGSPKSKNPGLIPAYPMKGDADSTISTFHEWMQGHSVIENWDTTLEDRTRILLDVASNYRQHLQRGPVTIQKFEKLLSQSAMHA